MSTFMTFSRRLRLGNEPRWNRTMILITAAVFCLAPGSVCSAQKNDLAAGSKNEEPEPPAKGKPEVRKLVDKGGRVSWYHGEKHELIAYDTVIDKDYNTAVFTIQPDGSERTCVTCDADIRKGFVGQPSWHPDGEHLVIQIENSNSKHNSFNFMSWGINNDLWIIRRDGKDAERIWSPVKNGAALHPHFSDDGRKLVFSERKPTGKSLAFLKGRTPGGENHWEGWRIHIASVHMDRSGPDKLSNHKTFAPNGPGFYETHGFAPGGRILYSFTPDGRPYVDDIFTVKQDGSGVVTEVEGSGTWDEHGLYSPDGERFAFMSSRFNSSLRFPRNKAKDLETELFVRDGDGPPVQVTSMNDLLPGKRVVSDYDWDRTGKRIVMQVAQMGRGQPVELWMLTFP